MPTEMSSDINSLTHLATVYSDSDEEGDNSTAPTITQSAEEQGKKRTRNDDVDNDSSECRKNTRMKLEIPTGILDMFKPTEVSGGPVSLSEHQGRVRSFDHFPGNWATHVLIPVELPENFSDFVDSLKSVWPEDASELNVGDLEDVHVSISRTVPIRHHWISPLREFLERGFRGQRRFVCDFPTIGVYVNDEKTRTFVALEADVGITQLKKLVAVVDKAFQEFGLPKYYEKPSFHASFSWSLGDISEVVQDPILNKMQAMLDSYVEDHSPLVFTAEEIQCRTGNKVFHFPLIKDN